LKLLLFLKSQIRRRNTLRPPLKLDPHPSESAARQQNVNRSFADDDVIKQLQDSIKQCCSLMAQMQQDMAGFKQQGSPPVKPCAPGYQPVPIQDYFYPATVDNAGQSGVYPTGQHGYFQGQPCPPSAAGAAPRYNYDSGQNVPFHTTAPADMYQEGTRQLDDVGRNSNIPIGRNNHAGTTPRRGGYKHRGAGRGRGACLRCGKQGHWARSCPSSGQGSTPNESA